MHRIHGRGATDDNKFTEGNPAIPIIATDVTDEWLNDVQENICKVIEDANIALVKGDYTQLTEAIKKMADSSEILNALATKVDRSDWQTLVPDKAWKLPNGFILQVTAYPTFSSSSNTTVTLPVTLPNRIIFASATIASSNSIAIAAYPITAQLSLSQIRVGAWASAATNLNGYLIVIGN